MNIEPNKVNNYKNPVLRSFFNLRWGAHHPDCKYYTHHVIRIFNHPLCIGCTFMGFGIISGIALIVYTKLSEFPTAILWFIGVFLYLSSLIQIKLTVHKKIKILLRYLLGLGTSFLILSIYYIQWTYFGILIKIGLLVIFYIVFQETIKYRSNHINDPCLTCSEGTFPFCSFKLKEMKNIISKDKEIGILELKDNKSFIPLISSLVAQFEGSQLNMVEFYKDSNENNKNYCNKECD